MMRLLNVLIGALVDGLLWPLRTLPPLAGLTAVSLLVALGLLAAFKLTSNQRALIAARRAIQAGLFELRLFQDDPLTLLRVIGDLARRQASYLRHALVPWLWMSVPLALILTHLHAHFGYDGLHPGQTATVIAHLKPTQSALTDSPPTAGRSSAAVADATTDATTSCPALTLDAPDGLRVDTPGVCGPARETAWRIAAMREGDYELRVSARPRARAPTAEPAAQGVGTTLPAPGVSDLTAAAVATKRVRVSPTLVAREPVRPAPTVWAQWRHPAEAPLPADSIFDAIEVTYPSRAIALFGFPLHWLLVFVVLSGLFTLLLKRAFHIVI